MKTSKATSTTTSATTSATTSKTTSFLAASVLGIFLTACGGSSAPTNGAVSGTVSGLGTGLSLALQNNGADTVAVAANGAFAFPTKLPSLGPFSITVLTQPVGQTCTVTRPTGVIPTDGNQANTTTVACAANSLGAVVTGLTAGSTVTVSNAGVLLVVNANGVATFPGILVGGTAFGVSIAAQPARQVCTLTSASGAITTGIQSLVRLNCV